MRAHGTNRTEPTGPTGPTRPGGFVLGMALQVGPNITHLFSASVEIQWLDVTNGFTVSKHLKTKKLEGQLNQLIW